MFTFPPSGEEMKNLQQVWSAEHMAPLANTNLHLLQDRAFSSNASAFYRDEVQVSIMALLEMSIFIGIGAKRK